MAWELFRANYVRPFVKRQKNDAADAEAIVIAARQPEMRFVVAKTAEQQAKAVVFRGRERLVHQRTELVNALRAVLYEYGHVFPVGFCHVNRIAAVDRNILRLAIYEMLHRDDIPPVVSINEAVDILHKEFPIIRGINVSGSSEPSLV